MTLTAAEAPISVAGKALNTLIHSYAAPGHSTDLRRSLGAVLHLPYSCSAYTMSATIEHPVCLRSMTKHLATTMSTGGCEGMDRTFKAVEHMRLAATNNRKSLVVLIAASFATRHGALSFVPLIVRVS